jgi:drug/metabolite transporter (DMT)-like permease
MRRLLAYAAIYLLWGGTYLAVRTVVLVTPPFSAAALRFLLSGLILLAISRLEQQPWPTLREWKHSSILGFVMFTINYACFFWAEQRLYSGVAAVLVATLPVWMLLAEWIMTRKRLSAASAAGAALGIAGVVLVSWAGARSAAHGASIPGQTAAQMTWASCVLLTGTICWAAGSVWGRLLILPPRQAVRAALQMTTGGLFLVVLAIGAGEARPALAAIERWTWPIWLCFAYLIAASIVAFTAYTWLLQHEPANRVSSYAYVNPIIALALGVGLAHERIAPLQVLGGGLVLLGVFATLRSRTPAPTRTAEQATRSETYAE